MSAADTSPTSEPVHAPQVDRIGALASGACAVHCALGVLLPAGIGVAGLDVLLGHRSEGIVTVVAVILAATALYLGWPRHRSLPVAALFVVGIFGLISARALEMGSDHGHHHHPEEAELASGAHHEAEAHGHGEGDERDPASGPLDAGSLLGMGAGLMLLIGHVSSRRAMKSRAAAGACASKNPAAA